MPFPNFHACRLVDPSGFDPDGMGPGVKFKTVTRGNVSVIVGKLKGESKTTAQSLRYPVEQWTAKEARKACQERDGIRFEPATGEGKNTMPEFSYYDAFGGEVSQSEFNQLLARKAIVFSFEKHVELETEDIDGVEIFAEGTFTDSAGNKQKWTGKDIDQMVANSKLLQDKVKPFLKLMHLEGKDHKKLTSMPALGWLQNFRHVGTKLVVDVKKVPKKVAALIKAGSFRRVSAEIFRTFKDEATGKVHKNVVSAAGILGAVHPAVTTLDDIMKLFGLGDAQPEQLVSVANDDWRESFKVKEADKNVVLCFYGATHEPLTKEGETDMTKEEVEKLIKDSVDKVRADAAKKHEADMSKIGEALGLKEGADPVEAIQSLKTGKESLEKSVAEGERKELDSKVDALFMDAKKACKITPAQEPGLRTMLKGWQSAATDGKLSFSKAGKETEGSVLEALEAHFEATPKIPGLKFEESGAQPDPDKVEDTVNDQIPEDVVRYAHDNEIGIDEESIKQDTEVKEFMASSGLSYSEALDRMTNSPRTPEPGVGLAPAGWKKSEVLTPQQAAALIQRLTA